MKSAKPTASEKKNVFVSVVVTPSEKKKLVEAAQRDERSLSEWVRRAALKQADSK